MATSYGNLINGQWVDSYDVNRNINPSDLDDLIGEYSRADAAQTRQAIAAAAAAFPAWARGNIQERADLLDRIGDAILRRKTELGTLLSREEGKTRPEGVASFHSPPISFSCSKQSNGMPRSLKVLATARPEAPAPITQ